MFEKPRNRNVVAVTTTLALIATSSACSEGGHDAPQKTPPASTSVHWEIPPAKHVTCAAQKLETWTPLAGTMDTNLLAQVLGVEKSQADAGLAGPAHCEQVISSSDMVTGPVIATVSGLGGRALDTECAVVFMESTVPSGQAPPTDALGRLHVTTRDVNVGCPGVS